MGEKTSDALAHPIKSLETLVAEVMKEVMKVSFKSLNYVIYLHITS